ncbi:polysaccharide biosynthesis tyrosine autokinase [Actinopolymorpha pittospori]
MELRDYLKVLRRRWRWLAVCMVATVAGATGLTLQVTPQYSSTIRMFVSTPEANNSDAYQGGLFSQQRVMSYADLATGPEIAERVVRKLGLDQTPAALTTQLSASVVPETVILRVAVTDPDRQQARRIAAATGEEFTSLVEQLETTPNQTSPPIKASVLGPPMTSVAPVSPNFVTNLGLAGVLGLLLGIGVAALREALDTSIRTSEDLAELTSVPALGFVTFDSDAEDNPIITSLESHAPRSEAFRVLRTNMQFVSVDKPSKIFVITSSVPGEGKTTIACNLAITMAQAGQRVALVDGDLRRPKVAEYLGLEPGIGLTTVLINRVTLEHALEHWWEDRLSVLTSGAIPPHPAELLQSRAMADLLTDLRSDYDIVIVDAPPILPVTDAALLAAQADGTVLVVRHGKTTRDHVRASVERLSSVGGRLVGHVLNMSPQRGESDTSYKYGYTPITTNTRRQVRPDGLAGVSRDSKVR